MRDILIVLALAVSAALFLGIGKYADDNHVRRDPERGVFYATSTLRSLLTDAPTAKRYVWPVLFPFDFIFMVVAAVSMAWASYHWGSSLGWFMDRPWLFLVLPFAYFAADLAEDVVIAMLMSERLPLSDWTVYSLKALTAAKLLAIALAFVQTVAAGIFYFRG
ncbi:MAG: hypothetical protein HY659_11285 [Rhizobiales bacterium]|nr:hypothetical protein [Hyphomicrobiales bacterium]